MFALRQLSQWLHTHKNVCNFFILWAGAAFGQHQISGIVQQGSGVALGYVTIHVHETMQAVQSDSLGRFKFQKLKSGHYHLHTQLVGYKSLEFHIDLHADTTLQIVMHAQLNELNEVVVETDPLRNTNAENSVKSQRVNEVFIQKYNGNTLSQTLEKIPGINSINMGIGVSKPVIRGLSMANVAVVDQGLKHEGQQWGADHGLEIDQYSIEEIEIVKGPASLMYGSDAIGGVLSIQQPRILQPNKHQAQIQGIFRSVNQTQGITAAAKGNTNGYLYKARITSLNYADYIVPASQFNYNRYILPIYNNQLKNTAGNELHGSLLLGVNKWWGYTHVTISNYNQNAGIFAGAAGIPRAYQLQPDNNRFDIQLPNQRINHFKIQSNSSIKLGNNWLEVDIGYQQNFRQERSAPESFVVGNTPMGSLALQLQLQTLSANIRYLKHWDDRHESAIGIQGAYATNGRSGYEYVVAGFTSQQSGLYALHKFKPSNTLTYNIGIRYDIGAIQLQGGSVTYYTSNGSVINTRNRAYPAERIFHNYSFGAGLSWHPLRWFNIKLNIGKSFRLPTSQELSANGFHHSTFRWERGDSSLQSMNGYHFDLGLHAELPKIQASVTPFVTYFDRYIYSKPAAVFVNEIDAGQLYQFTQAPALMSGGEVDVLVHPVRNLKLQLIGAYVYTYNFDTQLPLPLTPPSNLSPEVEYGFRNERHWVSSAYIRIAYAVYENQIRVERNERTTPGYELCNAGSGIGFARKGREFLTLHVQLNNVFNTLYMNHLSRYRLLNLPEPGRNVTAQLILRF